VLGPLWNKAIVTNKSPNPGSLFSIRRVILSGIEDVRLIEGFENFRLLPGVPFAEALLDQQSHKENPCMFFSRDGTLLRLREIKVEGEQVDDAYRAAVRGQMFNDRNLHMGAWTTAYFIIHSFES